MHGSFVVRPLICGPAIEQKGASTLTHIRFWAVRADKLALILVVLIALLGLAGYGLMLGFGFGHSTPVPRALLLRTVPTAATGQPLPPAATVGAQAPDFSLSTANGTSITLSSLRGKPVLLYFWASWCSFCRDDMPGLQKLQQEQKADLTILAINLLEKPELVKSFAAQLGISLTLLLDADGAVSAAYLVRATPTYAFINRDGILVAQVVGRPRPAVFEKNLALIMDEPPKKQQEIAQPEQPKQDKPPTQVTH